MTWAELVGSAPGWASGSAGLLLALAVLAWPRPAPVRVPTRSRRTATLPYASTARAPDSGSAPPAGRTGSAGLRNLLGRPAAASWERLTPDLVMELVACGLRSGLAVTDALDGAARAANGSDLLAGQRVQPSTAARRWALRPAGQPPSTLAEVVASLRLGVPPAQAWARPPPELQALAQAMVLAHLSGAPAAAVVARAAADTRQARRTVAELAAARLGVRLVLPLGLAILPGFVLLAVVPIVLGLAGTVLDAGR